MKCLKYNNFYELYNGDIIRVVYREFASWGDNVPIVGVLNFTDREHYNYTVYGSLYDPDEIYASVEEQAKYAVIKNISKEIKETHPELLL